MKRNKNRGYQQLRVWNDAVEYYKQTWEVFGLRKIPLLMLLNSFLVQYSSAPILHYSGTISFDEAYHER
jgi:hypothetical protein